MSKTKITFIINKFGPYIENDQINKIIKNKSLNIEEDFIRKNLISFFGNHIILTKNILEKYVEVTNKNIHPSLSPSTISIVDSILNPLISAKKSYCIEEYLSTIALCGIAIESLSIIVWDAKKVNLAIRTKEISKTQETKIFGKKVDDQGQWRRIEILKVLGFIDDEQFKLFDRIRNIRNNYIHLSKNKFLIFRKDANEIYGKSMELFLKILNLKLNEKGNGLIVKDRDILNYLSKNQINN